MFFVDKSINGNVVMEKQVNIIKDFFNSNFKPTINTFVAASSQIDEEITNTFDTVKPFDYRLLEKQFNDISNKTSTNENVSFYKLVAEVLINVDFSNINIYTKNPIIVLFLNSFVSEKNPTKNMLNNIMSSYPNIQIAAVVFDQKYSKDAEFLVGKSDMVYIFNEENKNEISYTSEWIINNICPSFSLTNGKPDNQDSFCGAFCDIAFAFDSSSDVLDSDLFNSEINITLLNIVPIIADYDRVATISYNQDVTNFQNFGSFNTKQDLDNYLLSLSQGSGSRLSLALAKLDSLNPPDNGKLSSFVFVTKYDAQEFQNAIPYAESLRKKGSLNFIILGTAVTKKQIEQLNPSNIFALTFGNACSNEIEIFYYKSLTCGSNSCITTPKPPTTKCISQETQCNVIISIDSSSDVLSDFFFYEVKDLIASNISSVFTNFNKIAIQAYNSQIQTIATFNSITNVNDFRNKVNSIVQGQGSNFYESLVAINNMIPTKAVDVSTYIFISKNDTNDFIKSAPIAAEIKAKGSLNIIIVGDALNPNDIEILNPTKYIIYDLSSCDNSAIVNFFSSQMNCYISCPTVTSTTKIITTNPVTTTKKNVITTTGSCVSQKTQCNVAISVDASSDILESFLFDIELDVISENVSSVFSDFNKVALQGYNSIVNPIYNFGDINNLNQFNNFLYSIKQNPGFNLSESLKNINNSQITNGLKLSTFVFISENNQAEFQKSVQLTKDLTAKGSLIIILLGTDVNENDISMLSYTNYTIFQLAKCNGHILTNLFNNYIDCYNTCSPSTTTITVPSTIVTTLPPTTTTTLPPCVTNTTQCNVAFAFDSSNYMISSFFDDYKHVLETVIPNYLTQFSKVSIHSFNSISYSLASYGSLQNISDFSNAVSSMTQAPGYNLHLALNDIYNEIEPDKNTNLATFVFLTKNDTNEFKLSSEIAQKLKSKGGLYVVIVETDLQPKDIVDLNPTDNLTITVRNCDAYTLGLFINRYSNNCTQKCTTPLISTTTPYLSTSTTTPTPTLPISTTTPTPTSVCTPGLKQCNIAIIIDASSDVLSFDFFENEINTLANNVAFIFNDYSKIAIESYNSDAYLLANFNSIGNSSMFSKDVQNAYQKSGFNLYEALNKINNLPLQDKNVGLSTYVFISKNDTNQFNLSKDVASQLRKKGSLNIIISGTALYDTDIAVLNPSTNITFDVAECDPQVIINFIKQEMVCTVPCSSPTTLPPTTTTTLPPTTTITVPSTIVTTLPPTTTTTLPPCVTNTTQCNVAFAFDSSNYMISSFFDDYKHVLETVIPNYLTQFSKVSIHSFNSISYSLASYGSLQNISDFSNAVSSMTQAPGYNLHLALNDIYNEIEPDKNTNLATFVFLTKNDTNEFKLSSEIAQKLKSKGGLYVVIVETDLQPKDIVDLNPTDNLTITVRNCDAYTLGLFINRYSNNCTQKCNAPSISTTTPYLSTSTTTKLIPVTTTPTSTLPISTTTPQCQCRKSVCNVAIVLDTSTTLSPNYFIKEKEAIMYNVSSSFKNFNNIALLEYDQTSTVLRDFGKIIDYNDFIYTVNSTYQSPGSNLTAALQQLKTLTTLNKSYLNSYIMISTPPIGDLKTNQQLVQDLINNSGTVNIILLGTGVKLSDVIPLNATTYYSYDLALCDTGGLVNYFNQTTACSTVCGTIPPQKMCSMIISPDASNDILDVEEFNYQMNVIANNVSSIIPNFRDIALIPWNEFPNTTFGFDVIRSVGDFQQDIYLMKQNIGSKLSSLLNSFFPLVLNRPSSIFVFISTNDPNEISMSVKSVNNLRNTGSSLNFILVGTDIHPNDLQIFNLPSDNIYQWDFTKCPISDLLNFIKNNIQCTNQCL
ncbi:von Willebrand factor, type A domain-containing protein [Strongyloides ratti]|uniref:von Willebrand factor, type A domain-containing protein n=1 Tax=Strongyloides ratti TaxID=34506 RepID=A0A090KV85_STRRB|nr:von Willebrand factor, type A domain-containing protein [Strongyloides ratti]CEF61326.1 von Willebrand factor, type A domain-containing protein [Strongyloides ratti]